MRLTTLLLFLLFCVAGNGQQVVSSTPLVIGVSLEIHSQELGENRKLNIYLPDGYKAGDTTHYPVIYLLDGGMDEDFIHISGLVQFNTFPWIQRFPNSILVGIVNTDRKRDFTFPSSIKFHQEKIPNAGGSAKFRSFLQKELIPFIANRYPVTSDRMLIGQSLGGLFATEILFSQPELFNRFIIVSPSLWWNDASLLHRSILPAVLSPNFDQPVSIYIGVGKEGKVPGNRDATMEGDAETLANYLKNAKKPGVTVFFDFLPGEDHATVGHQAVFNALRMLYPR
ncbi:MAG: alpha/beta hydrolase-fold protein [Bacteroidota bacterium]